VQLLQLNLDSAVTAARQIKAPDEWVLVGYGNRGKNCGDIVPVLSCQSCHKVHYVKSHCNQKACPNCYETWHKNRSAKIKLRLTSWKAKQNNKYKRIKHIVLAPAEELFRNEDPWSLRALAIDFLYSISSMYIIPKNEWFDFPEHYGFTPRRNNNYSIPKSEWDKIPFDERMQIKDNCRVINSTPSGVLIFHPWRTTAEANKKAYAANMKKWEWVRAQGPNWKDYVYWSPHFHFVGYVGWLSVPESGTGWVYKTITEEFEKGRKVSILKPKEVYFAVSYLLSHTGTIKDKPNVHSYVYIGNLADRNGESEEEKQLKKFGVLYPSDGDIILSSKSINDLKKLKATCKYCKRQGKTGKLFYMYQNLLSFFKAYEIPFDGVHWEGVEESIKRINAPNYIKLHVLECIHIKQDKGPPVDYLDYLIE